VWRKGFFAFRYKGNHKDLTVAYDWPEDISDEEILKRLV
jgi:hypothetical protein